MNPNNPSGQPGQPNYPSPMGYPMDYYAAASPFLTQQFGNHIATAFQDQVTQYSGNIVTKSHSWVSKNLQHYFGVDTGYVLKKIFLIFFPFSHRDWSYKYRNNEPTLPRDDINAPDLYIPTMAYVTYVVVAGCLLGVNEKFTPEQLGIQASSALAFLIIEILLTLVILQAMSLPSRPPLLHILALSSYKFVPMIAALLSGLFFHKFGYYISLCYGSITLFFFLLRSLHRAVEGPPTSHEVSSSSVLKLIFYCVIQPPLMYFLTNHLVTMSEMSLEIYRKHSLITKLSS